MVTDWHWRTAAPPTHIIPAIACGATVSCNTRTPKTGARAGPMPRAMGYVIKHYGWRVMLTEWRIDFKGIIACAILSFLAYGMILTALQFSRVSYIAPAREISVVIGALLGIIVLKESFGKGLLSAHCRGTDPYCYCPVRILSP